jgi:hypothetical protein
MMDRQFLELLPWYANGTLADADRAKLEDVLHRDAHAGAELQWLQQVQQHVQTDLPGLAQVSDEIGLERTMRRIHADAAAEQAAVARAEAAQAAAAPKAAGASRRGPSLIEQVRGWFEGMRLSPAFAMAALVIVVQTGVIFKLAGSDSDYEQVRSIPGAPAASGQLFRVAFKPEASETDIRLLLVGVQGNIESGPGQLGDYYVRVPVDAALDAGAKLKAASVVDSVLTVDAVPPRGH